MYNLDHTSLFAPLDMCHTSLLLDLLAVLNLCYDRFISK